MKTTPLYEGFFDGGKYMNPREYQPRRVEIIDTTLRDGLQSPLWHDTGKNYPTIDDKLAITEGLMRHGVRFIEVFSPIANEREKDDLRFIIARKNEVAKEIDKPSFILAHVRCHPKDVEAVFDHSNKVGLPIDGFNFYMGTSEQSREHNHGKTLRQIIETARPLLEDLRRNHPALALRFSGEDAFRTSTGDLFAVYDPIADLVDRFGTPDTVGIAIPQQVAERVALLRERYPKIALEGHFHNDRGLALINAMTAIHEGMQYINTSILGLAERSGINSMTALLFNLFLEDPKLLEGFDYSLSYPLNVLVADILRTQVPTTEPISLTNRTHTAGVHSGAVLKNSTVYEAHPLAKFGVTEQRLLLGPLSGLHLVGYYLREILYFEGVTGEIAEDISREFKDRVSELHDRKTPKVLLEEIALKRELKKSSRASTANIEILTNGEK